MLKRPEDADLFADQNDPDGGGVRARTGALDGRPSAAAAWIALVLALENERRRAEAWKAEAERAAERLDEILGSINDHLVVYDREWRYTYVNDGASAMLGLPKEDLLGRCIWELFPEAVGNLYYRELHRAVAEQRDLTFDHYYEPWDAWIENRVYVLREGVAVFGSDVTGRKRAEAERLELLEQAREMQRAAEAASRMKDDFLATLSHELRTPLNAIIGWSEILHQQRLNPSQVSHAIEVINRNARSQARLIEDLLDVSAVITGNLRLEVRPVELTAMVEAAIEAVQPAAEAKAIRLECAVEPVGAVQGDATRLQQVVWNLLSNAVKFTPRGGVVRVEVRRNASAAEIIVRDTGQGIAPEFLPHIFDRFSQADGSRTRRHGGLGLGLAIARHLVEMHGGTVRAESEGEGRGSTFIVSLPLLLTAAPARPAAGGRQTAARSLAGARLLLVDDHADTREMLAALLACEGAEVRAAASADEALQQVAEWRPDALVSDIGMPGADGYDLLGRIRALPAEAGGRMPALALTGYASPEEGERALAAGFQMHLAKPVEPDQLLKALTALVKRSADAER